MENSKRVQLDPIIFSWVMLLWCVSTRFDLETNIYSACEPGIWLLSNDFLKLADACDLVVSSRWSRTGAYLDWQNGRREVVVPLRLWQKQVQ